MRYQKGSFELSRAQDLPLLRQVLRSQYSTHDQMYEFMRLGCHEIRRQSFNWRIKRLVDHQMVLRHYVAAAANTYVYSIGTLGFLYLQGVGEPCAGSVFSPAKRPEDLHCFHSIELNNLQLALARQNLLEEWIPEIEIRSRNELTGDGYAKDYDALVTVRLGREHRRFALEYERSPKTFRHYEGIRNRIEAETEVNEFLYLAANEHLQMFLMRCFAATKRRLFIGTASEFQLNLLETPVIEASSGVELRLAETL